MHTYNGRNCCSTSLDFIVCFHKGFESDRRSLDQMWHIHHSAVQANLKALLIINQDIVIGDLNTRSEEEDHSRFTI